MLQLILHENGICGRICARLSRKLSKQELFVTRTHRNLAVSFPSYWFLRPCLSLKLLNIIKLSRFDFVGERAIRGYRLRLSDDDAVESFGICTTGAAVLSLFGRRYCGICEGITPFQVLITNNSSEIAKDSSTVR